MNNKLAVVTMVYNEPLMLPLWQKYYSAQAGSASCYVIDHGSSDGSTAEIQSNVLRIPRSPMDDVKRARFVSSFCSALLEWYGTVIYTDVDEFLIADPQRHSSLSDFCNSATAPVITAIGLNVQHVLGVDSALSGEMPILRQRRWARFAPAMCKPLVIKVPVKWTAGFHLSDQPTVFSDLFLFHLHHFDLPSALQRLAKTREMAWNGSSAGSHQRLTDEAYETMISAISGLRRESDCTFSGGESPLSAYTKAILEFMEKNPSKRNRYYVDAGITCNELLQIPERFIDQI